jgi:peroxiredoxin
MVSVVRSLKYLPLVAAGFAVMAPAWAIKPGQKMDNFTLTDESGKARELYSLADKKAVVIMIQGNGCPIVRQAMPAYREVRDAYKAQGLEFLLLNPNLQDTAATTAAESKEFGFDIPVLMDGRQLIAEKLDVNRTAEIFVFNPKDWTLMYRGPLDDRLSYEKQRPKANHEYLKMALNEMLAGKAVSHPKVDGPGCIVNMEERDRRKAQSRTRS